MAEIESTIVTSTIEKSKNIKKTRSRLGSCEAGWRVNFLKMGFRIINMELGNDLALQALSILVWREEKNVHKKVKLNVVSCQN